MYKTDLAEIFQATADQVEGRAYNTFVGGPNLWSALHVAAWDLVTGPASEQLRQMVGLAQLQHWHGSQDEAVELLRKAASGCGELTVLREEHTAHRLEEARQSLIAAMGWDGSTDLNFGGMTRAVADEVKRLRTVNERLSEELRAARQR